MAELATPAKAGEDARALEVTLAVAEVTVLEDRGVVSRRGRVKVPAGRSRLRVEGVSPALVDKTLVALLADADGGQLPEGVRVRDVKIKRRRVTQDADRPADLAAVRSKVRNKEVRRDALQHEMRALEAEAVSLRSLEAMTLQEIGEDAGWARHDAARWDDQLQQLAARQKEIGETLCERAQAFRRVERDLSDLRTLADSKTHLDARAAAALEVEFVNGGGEPCSVDLRIDYVVPGAAWRPWHTARLVERDDGATVEFRTAGCVWQATGEDWTDVEIRFSTERPSLGVTPPLLATDLLAAYRRGPAVEVAARDQKINTAGLGASQAEDERVEDELPGIDDGGDALELRGRTRVTVPGDGRPHRVPIFEFEAPAEVAWVCTPELADAVMVRARQGNRSEHPLLAGPVDLIRDSGLVGRTSLLFVAPGETFELGFGPDSALRVSRKVEALDHQRRALSSWTRKPKKITVKLSNIGAAPRTVELKERIAVSEVEKVEVEFVEASPKAKPDKEGFLTWSVPLRGFGRESVSLKWTLVVHDDVVGM